MAISTSQNTQKLRIFAVILLSQVVVATLCVGAYFLIKPNFDTTSTVLLTALVAVFCEVVAAYIISEISVQPMQDVARALLYAYSDKPVDKNSTIVELIRRLHAENEPEKVVSTTEYEFAQALLDNLPMGIVVLNPKREILYANKAAPTIGGGKELNINFSESDSLSNWLDSVAGNNISASRWWRRMRQVSTEEDKRQFFDLLAIYHQEGVESIETILVTVDRTAEYSTDEDDLDFTALAAHELRGPITVIKGYIDVLRQELKLTEDQQAFFERLDVSADRLTTYINNILNVSRYDRRHLKLHLKEDSLAKVYSAVGDDLDLRARTHHRMLNVSIPEDLPSIAADRGSLSEVIVNLVDNAIKYSSEGGLIVLSAEVKDNFVQVSVQDNGIGIPSSLIAHIFDKFYRSHRSRENTVGTGLGLYITKAIVESHGGTISVRSEEGKGSTFTFNIPTYASVADKLATSNNSNESMIAKKDKKFIKNHSMYRG